MSSSVSVGLNAVVIAVTDEEPRVLVLRPADGARPSPLPFGPLEPDAHRTLELGLRAWVRERTGLDLGYVEQLYTFGDRNRQRQESHSERVLSIAYLALVNEPAGGAEGVSWRPVYSYLPWEDWREGRPAVLDRRIIPALRGWADRGGHSADRRAKRERLEITFGRAGAPWNGDRVLERYELLYEAGLVAEAARQEGGGEGAGSGESGEDAELGEPGFGREMPFDHRRILATALGRLRGKIRYRPVIFELMPPTFTLFQLQRTVEALAGVRLHKQNFRRLVDKGGLVEGTGRIERNTGGRPAELFRFRHEVLRERPAPGVGLPGHRGPGA